PPGGTSRRLPGGCDLARGRANRVLQPRLRRVHSEVGEVHGGDNSMYDGDVAPVRVGGVLQLQSYERVCSEFSEDNFTLMGLEDLSNHRLGPEHALDRGWAGTSRNGTG